MPIIKRIYTSKIGKNSQFGLLRQFFSTKTTYDEFSRELMMGDISVPLVQVDNLVHTIVSHDLNINGSAKPVAMEYIPEPESSVSESDDVTRLIRWLIQKSQLKQDVFILGPPDSTTHEAVMYFCRLTEKECEYLSITSDTSEADLKQRTELIDNTLHYINQAPVSSALNGRVLVLDGIQNAERGVLPTLNNLLENREMNLEDGSTLVSHDRYESLLKTHTKEELDGKKILRVHEDFKVFVIGVPVPKYRGYPLDPPLRSRFQSYVLNYELVYNDMLSQYPSVPQNVVDYIYQLVSLLRMLHNNSGSESSILNPNTVSDRNQTVPYVSTHVVTKLMRRLDVLCSHLPSATIRPKTLDSSASSSSTSFSSLVDSIALELQLDSLVVRDAFLSQLISDTLLHSIIPFTTLNTHQCNQVLQTVNTLEGKRNTSQDIIHGGSLLVNLGKHLQLEKSLSKHDTQSNSIVTDFKYDMLLGTNIVDGSLNPHISIPVSLITVIDRLTSLTPSNTNVKQIVKTIFSNLNIMGDTLFIDVPLQSSEVNHDKTNSDVSTDYVSSPALNNTLAHLYLDLYTPPPPSPSPSSSSSSSPTEVISEYFTAPPSSVSLPPAVMLLGQPGGGKSALVRELTHLLNTSTSTRYMYLYRDMSSRDLLQKRATISRPTDPDSVSSERTKTSTVWRDSDLVTSMKYGYMCVLDGIHKLPPSTISVLKSVCHRGDIWGATERVVGEREFIVLRNRAIMVEAIRRYTEKYATSELNQEKSTDVDRVTQFLNDTDVDVGELIHNKMDHSVNTDHSHSDLSNSVNQSISNLIQAIPVEIFMESIYSICHNESLFTSSSNDSDSGSNNSHNTNEYNVTSLLSLLYPPSTPHLATYFTTPSQQRIYRSHPQFKLVGLSESPQGGFDNDSVTSGTILDNYGALVNPDDVSNGVSIYQIANNHSSSPLPFTLPPTTPSSSSTPAWFDDEVQCMFVTHTLPPISLLDQLNIVKGKVPGIDMNTLFVLGKACVDVSEAILGKNLVKRPDNKSPVNQKGNKEPIDPYNYNILLPLSCFHHNNHQHLSLNPSSTSMFNHEQLASIFAAIPATSMQTSLRHLLFLARTAVLYPTDISNTIKRMLLVAFMPQGVKLRVLKTMDSVDVMVDRLVQIRNKTKVDDIGSEVEVSLGQVTDRLDYQSFNSDNYTITPLSDDSSVKLPSNVSICSLTPSSPLTSTLYREGMTALKINSTILPRFPPLNSTLIPSPVFFFTPAHTTVLEGLMRDLRTGVKHLLLIGNQGVGKNKVIDKFCELMLLEREYIQLHRDTTVTSLMTSAIVTDGVVDYVYSPLVTAAIEGRVCVVDEADKANVEVVGVLRGLIEDGEMLLPNGERLVDIEKYPQWKDQVGSGVIPIHPNFKLFLLANRPGFPFLGNDLFKVCGDVLSVHNIDAPDFKSEVELAKAYGPDVDEVTMTKLVMVFQHLRRMNEEGKLTYPYSTRELVNIIKHLQSFGKKTDSSSIQYSGVAEAVMNTIGFDAYDVHSLKIVCDVFSEHGIPVSPDLVINGGSARFEDSVVGQVTGIFKGSSFTGSSNQNLTDLEGKLQGGARINTDFPISPTMGRYLPENQDKLLNQPLSKNRVKPEILKCSSRTFEADVMTNAMYTHNDTEIPMCGQFLHRSETEVDSETSNIANFNVALDKLTHINSSEINNKPSSIGKFTKFTNGNLKSMVLGVDSKSSSVIDNTDSPLSPPFTWYRKFYTSLLVQSLQRHALVYNYNTNSSKKTKSSKPLLLSSSASPSQSLPTFSPVRWRALVDGFTALKHIPAEGYPMLESGIFPKRTSDSTSLVSGNNDSERSSMPKWLVMCDFDVCVVLSPSLATLFVFDISVYLNAQVVLNQLKTPSKHSQSSLDSESSLDEFISYLQKQQPRILDVASDNDSLYPYLPNNGSKNTTAEDKQIIYSIPITQQMVRLPRSHTSNYIDFMKDCTLFPLSQSSLTVNTTAQAPNIHMYGSEFSGSLISVALFNPLYSQLITFNLDAVALLKGFTSHTQADELSTFNTDGVVSNTNVVNAIIQHVTSSTSRSSDNFLVSSDSQANSPSISTYVSTIALHDILPSSSSLTPHSQFNSILSLSGSDGCIYLVNAALDITASHSMTTTDRVIKINVNHLISSDIPISIQDVKLSSNGIVVVLNNNLILFSNTQSQAKHLLSPSQQLAVYASCQNILSYPLDSSLGSVVSLEGVLGSNSVPIFSTDNSDTLATLLLHQPKKSSTDSKSQYNFVSIPLVNHHTTPLNLLNPDSDPFTSVDYSYARSMSLLLNDVYRTYSSLLSVALDSLNSSSLDSLDNESLISIINSLKQLKTFTNFNYMFDLINKTNVNESSTHSYLPTLPLFSMVNSTPSSLTSLPLSFNTSSLHRGRYSLVTTWKHTYDVFWHNLHSDTLQLLTLKNTVHQLQGSTDISNIITSFDTFLQYLTDEIGIDKPHTDLFPVEVEALTIIDVNTDSNINSTSTKSESDGVSHISQIVDEFYSHTNSSPLSSTGNNITLRHIPVSSLPISCVYSHPPSPTPSLSSIQSSMFTLLESRRHRLPLNSSLLSVTPLSNTQEAALLHSNGLMEIISVDERTTTSQFQTWQFMNGIVLLPDFSQDEIYPVTYSSVPVDISGDNSSVRYSGVIRKQINGTIRKLESSIKNNPMYKLTVKSRSSRREMKSTRPPKDLSAPKKGKVDPDNTPHVGGNTWAGGTGGSDTAGLGGRGGPHRLDAGHDVHQVSDEAKRSITDKEKQLARSVGVDMWKEQLKKIGMSTYDIATYEKMMGGLHGFVQDVVRCVMLSTTEKRRRAVELERVWLKRQSEGEMDETMIVDAVIGDKHVYKRRATVSLSPHSLHPQNDIMKQSKQKRERKKRIMLVCDLSASMYRFNGYDQRLTHSINLILGVCEAMRQVHQANVAYEKTSGIADNDYLFSVHGHSGESKWITLVPTCSGEMSPADMLKLREVMQTHAQYCLSGDNTLPSYKKAIEEALKPISLNQTKSKTHQSRVELDYDIDASNYDGAGGSIGTAHGIDALGGLRPTSEQAADTLVLFITDANLQRYRIPPSQMGSICKWGWDNGVRNYCLVLGSSDEESRSIVNACPEGKAIVIKDTSKIGDAFKFMLSDMTEENNR